MKIPTVYEEEYIMLVNKLNSINDYLNRYRDFLSKSELSGFTRKKNEIRRELKKIREDIKNLKNANSLGGISK
ncbi:MAG TPA: hypothetical protein GXZ95_04650 [Mollicutes bacterium]|nr:hypothetical protein [Mollicutes bacterium]